jgi:hypothetical protein
VDRSAGPPMEKKKLEKWSYRRNSALDGFRIRNSFLNKFKIQNYLKFE